MSQEIVNTSKTAIEILREALKYTLSEIAYLIPKIVISIIIIVIFFAIALVLTKIIRKILNIMKLENIVKKYVKYTIPVNTIIIALINLGIAFIAIYTIVLVIYPEAMIYISAISNYVGRVVSVAFLIVFAFIIINTIIDRLKMERGLRGFMMILIFLISMILIVDITSLTPEVKSALTWGLSLGIGLSIGVFTIWYFFSDLLKKRSEEL